MLRITVELCPDGEVSAARTITAGVVGRVVGPDAHGVATYVAAFDADGYRDQCQATVTHRPANGPWKLVANALAAALEGGTVDERHQASLTEALARARPSHPLSAQRVVSELRELLTPRLTAFIGGVDETAVTRAWAEGTRDVPDAVEVRLRVALDVAHILTAAYDAATAQVWLQGQEPALGDVSPLTVLRDENDDRLVDVVRAARGFSAS
jgi:hypothetical protein